MARADKRCGLILAFLLLLTPAAHTQEQSELIGLKLERSGVSPRLDELKPQAEPDSYPAPVIKKIDFPEVRYLLVAHFGPLFFCDRYMHPVVNVPLERAQAIMAFPMIQGDTTTFREIARHLNLERIPAISDDQKLLIYREYRMLRDAVQLDPEGDGFKYRISVLPRRSIKGFVISGRIDVKGEISVLEKIQVYLECPMCLTAGTRIDTPVGQVAVEDLKSGIMVWTVDARGRRVAAPILVVSAVRVPVGHSVVHISLDDGREVRVSPGHPTADGRDVSALKVGSQYDGARIVRAELEIYSHAETFDLLPAGDTGFYWANGILLASTLR
jgi:hypothetical protein